MQADMKKRVRRLIAVWCVVIAAGAVYAAVFFAFGVGIPCPFHLITGLNCPGCGISRAIRSIAEFRFADALGYNLMAPLILLYIGYCAGFASVTYLNTGKSSLLVKPEWLNIALLSLFMIWWVVRNIFGI